MPVTLKFDPAGPGPQALIIQDANCFQDGVLSKELACKLINLPPDGGACCPNVTDIKTANYNAAVLDVVQCNPPGPINVTFPAITPANRSKEIVVWVSPESGQTVTILPTGGDQINNGPSESLNSGAMGFISNGVDNWLKLY